MGEDGDLLFLFSSALREAREGKSRARATLLEVEQALEEAGPETGINRIRVPACPVKAMTVFYTDVRDVYTRDNFLINLTQRDHLGPTKHSHLLLGGWVGSGECSGAN